jgi:hypothetical protein
MRLIVANANPRPRKRKGKAKKKEGTKRKGRWILAVRFSKSGELRWWTGSGFSRTKARARKYRTEKIAKDEARRLFEGPASEAHSITTLRA